MGVVDDLIFTSDPDADPDGGQQRGRIHDLSGLCNSLAPSHTARSFLSKSSVSEMDELEFSASYWRACSA